jgi:hypothetical protein
MAVYGGLQPWKNVKSANLYRIASNESSDIFKGDPIKALVTGFVTVCEAAPTAPFVGAALGFFDDKMNPLKFYDASEQAAVCFVLVADDPNQDFVMAEDAAATPLALTDIFAPITFTTGTGDSETGLSAFTIDSSEPSATATDPIKVINLAPIMGNTVYSATLCPNPKWIVRPNFSVLNDTTGLLT